MKVENRLTDRHICGQSDCFIPPVLIDSGVIIKRVACCRYCWRLMKTATARQRTVCHMPMPHWKHKTQVKSSCNNLIRICCTQLAVTKNTTHVQKIRTQEPSDKSQRWSIATGKPSTERQWTIQWPTRASNIKSLGFRPPTQLIHCWLYFNFNITNKKRAHLNSHKVYLQNYQNFPLFLTYRLVSAFLVTLPDLHNSLTPRNSKKCWGWMSQTSFLQHGLETCTRRPQCKYKIRCIQLPHRKQHTDWPTTRRLTVSHN